jgi:hypothetical protein
MATGLDAQLQVWSSSTTITGTVLSTYSVDLAVASRHAENGTEIGFGVFPNTFSANASDTIEFQVISADNAGLTSNPTVIRTTGAMANTDSRLTPGVEQTATVTGVVGGGNIFLTIDPNRISQEYIGMKAIAAGNSITVNAYLMNDAEFNQTYTHAANYTP